MKINLKVNSTDCGLLVYFFYSVDLYGIYMVFIWYLYGIYMLFIWYI